MDIKITTTRKEGYLQISIVGERSIKNIIDATIAILDECGKQEVMKVVVDITEMTGQLNIPETFELPTKVFPKLRDREVINRAAILDLPTNLKRTRFFETVAQNRGFNLRMFSAEAEAVTWLIE